MTQLTESEQKLIDAGLDVQAIKRIRQRTGCSLIEAKQVRDGYYYARPENAKRIRERFKEVQRGLAKLAKNDDLVAMRRVNVKFAGYFSEVKQEKGGET